MEKQNSRDNNADYEIKVKGKLGTGWSDWFEGLTIKDEGAVTIICGKVRDQPALHGLLVRIRDLGLILVSVARIETDQMGDIDVK